MRRRRWAELEWIERFGYTVLTGAWVIIAVLVLALALTSCASTSDPPPTLPSIGSLPRPPRRVPPPTTVLFCGSLVPPDDCGKSYGP